MQTAHHAHTYLGRGDISVVRTPVSWSKECGFKPGKSGRINLFAMVNFLCWLYFGISSTLCYCSSMWKILAILPKGQVAVKHTCTLHMGLSMKWHCKLVHGCTVYTECVLRQQQLHVAPAMQQPNSALSMPLTWIIFFFFNQCKRLQSLIYNHMWQELSKPAQEQRIALYKNGINNVYESY